MVSLKAAASKSLYDFNPNYIINNGSMQGAFMYYLKMVNTVKNLCTHKLFIYIYVYIETWFVFSLVLILRITRLLKVVLKLL